jgi:putative transcriptional regulator
MLHRLALLAAPLVAAFLAAAVPEGGAGGSDSDAGSSLAGQLLVASPGMGDPRFAETVILMVRHNKMGAFGIVINRPIEERSLASLLQELAHPDPSVKGNVRVYAGGPVEPAAGFIVHSADYHRPETMSIDGKVAVTSSAEILRDMGHGAGPAKALVAFGYAGWGPGQLETELAHRDWFNEPEDPAMVFDLDRSILWHEALDRRDRSL